MGGFSYGFLNNGLRLINLTSMSETNTWSITFENYKMIFYQIQSSIKKKVTVTYTQSFYTLMLQLVL